MKTETSLARIFGAFLETAACVSARWSDGLVVAREASHRNSPSPRAGAAVGLWRHLRAEFEASEATEGKLVWLLWSAGLVMIGCFLATML